MHTSEFGYTRFIYNSDLSGEVEIVNLKTNKRLWASGDDLLAFVGDYVKKCKVAELEDMDPLDVLQIKRR